jgi:hypothetical protein
MRVPMRGEVAWLLPEGDKPYWRGTVTALDSTTRLLKWRRGAAAWTPDQAPEALRSLPPAMRRKAIEIANGLLQEGVDEERAIRIATAKARSWALQQQRQSDDR